MAMVCLPSLLHFKGEMDDELERRNWLVKDLGTVHKVNWNSNSHI